VSAETTDWETSKMYGHYRGNYYKTFNNLLLHVSSLVTTVQRIQGTANSFITKCSKTFNNLLLHVSSLVTTVQRIQGTANSFITKCSGDKFQPLPTYLTN